MVSESRLAGVRSIGARLLAFWPFERRRRAPVDRELSGCDAATLKDIGITPDVVFAARCGEEGPPGRAGFDS